MNIYIFLVFLTTYGGVYFGKNWIRSTLSSSPPPIHHSPLSSSHQPAGHHFDHADCRMALRVAVGMAFRLLPVRPAQPVPLPRLPSALPQSARRVAVCVATGGGRTGGGKWTAPANGLAETRQSALCENANGFGGLGVPDVRHWLRTGLLDVRTVRADLHACGKERMIVEGKIREKSKSGIGKIGSFPPEYQKERGLPNWFRFGLAKIFRVGPRISCYPRKLW